MRATEHLRKESVEGHRVGKPRGSDRPRFVGPRNGKERADAHHDRDDGGDERRGREDGGRRIDQGTSRHREDRSADRGQDHEVRQQVERDHDDQAEDDGPGNRPLGRADFVRRQRGQFEAGVRPENEHERLAECVDVPREERGQVRGDLSRLNSEEHDPSEDDQDEGAELRHRQEIIEPPRLLDADDIGKDDDRDEGRLEQDLSSLIDAGHEGHEVLNEGDGEHREGKPFRQQETPTDHESGEGPGDGPHVGVGTADLWQVHDAIGEGEGDDAGHDPGQDPDEQGGGTHQTGSDRGRHVHVRPDDRSHHEARHVEGAEPLARGAGLDRHRPHAGAGMRGSAYSLSVPFETNRPIGGRPHHRRIMPSGSNSAGSADTRVRPPAAGSRDGFSPRVTT